MQKAERNGEWRIANGGRVVGAEPESTGRGIVGRRVSGRRSDTQRDARPELRHGANHRRALLDTATGPRAVPGSQRPPERHGDQVSCTLPAGLNALRAGDGSRSVIVGRFQSLVAMSRCGQAPKAADKVRAGSADLQPAEALYFERVSWVTEELVWAGNV